MSKKIVLQKHHPFAIAGIGASAGGLEALTQFLQHVPEQSGIAYVIVQHLDPTHKGALTELLQTATSMKVVQIKDRMQVKPDCVYVIPPNRELSILHGVLHLFEPTEPRGLRFPIDSFFRSLAEDRKKYSICIVLSGMGSDGTIGLRAIKEQAGLVVAQEPSSAKFDSMPCSAINTGLVDIIAPSEELPAQIISCLRHGTTSKNAPIIAPKGHSALEKIIILLRTKTGHDFSSYKTNTLSRRIERRMGIHQIDKLDFYLRYLQENPQELELLFKELLIGVTSFFRDSAEWDLLRDDALPSLLTAPPVDGVLRAWSAGCSTGEEAYSLAILFKEMLERQTPKVHLKLQIFATDLDQDAIDRARLGVYPANISADISAERLDRFFTLENNGYRVGREIREMVTFATQNLISDPPFTKLNLIICRNLLIYLNTDLQHKLLPLFHYSLKTGGLLFLGSAESIGNFNDLFAPLYNKSRIFRRRELTQRTEAVCFPANFSHDTPHTFKEFQMPKAKVNLQSLVDQLILREHASPAVLVNAQGDILYINGRTGKYLEPAAGKANWNICAMVREELRFVLIGAFHKAVRLQETLSMKGLSIGNNGEAQTINLHVQPLTQLEELQGMVLIVFQPCPSSSAQSPDTSNNSATNPPPETTALVLELKLCQQELLAAKEGMQSSREELISMNEELQSTNEELQSTNEELTTSKEELQSMNEELQTVNAEQQSKLEDLSRVNKIIDNLLGSTQIITLFLDNALNIRRFSGGADKLFKLIPGDIGRPLTDMASELFFPQLPQVATDVLQNQIVAEFEIPTLDERWFLARVMPYHTQQEVVDGLVITFTNISVTKKLEAELARKASLLQAQLDSATFMIIGLSAEGQILNLNPVAEKNLGLGRNELINKNFFDLFIPGKDSKVALNTFKEMLASKSSPLDFTTPIEMKNGATYSIRWSSALNAKNAGDSSGVVAIGQEINLRNTDTESER